MIMVMIVGDEINFGDRTWVAGYDRGDSMIWDYGPPVRDYLVSIQGGIKFCNHVFKVWRLLIKNLIYLSTKKSSVKTLN